MPENARSRFLQGLSAKEAHEAEHGLPFWLRDEQLAPSGDWRIWLFLGGRGAGKTLAGAHWLAENIQHRRTRRVGLIGATFNDTRAIMIEGESGLLKLCAEATFEPSNRRITWPGGAIATVLSADEPDSLRGHQFDGLWLDEFAKWPDPQAALDMALMALRLGDDPRMVITTTPRAIESVKTLLNAPDVAVTRSTTRANAVNLAPGFFKRWSGAMPARASAARNSKPRSSPTMMRHCGGGAGSMRAACVRRRRLR